MQLELNDFEYASSIRQNKDYSIYSKSLEYLDNNLYRNVSNISGSFNGYGLPVGELCNPYYNTENNPAAFMTDEYKRNSVDYFDYVSTVYGVTKSMVKTHGVVSDLPMNGGVGVVDTYRITGSTSASNPNGGTTDTTMGENSAQNAYTSLSRSINYYAALKDRNYIVHAHQPITLNMFDNFGMNIEALLGNAIAGISTRLDESTGRFVMLTPNFAADITSIQEWGDLSSSGYKKLYDMSSYDSVQRYFDNLVNMNKYRLMFSNQGSTYTYFESVGITPTSNGGKRYSWNADKQVRNNIAGRNAIYTYGEAENGVAHDTVLYSFNDGIRFGSVSTYGDMSDSVNDMLYKTNKGFRDGEYKTLIGRFHTSSDDVSDNDTKQTAVSKKFGMSHGRNLLIKGASENMSYSPDNNGYSNPYCRVWTYHHQYSRLRDTVRPFIKDENGGIISQGELYSTYGYSAFSSDGNGSMNGRERLGNYGVLNKNNGLVNITPINSSDNSKNVSVKNCMFSIENLAWKDVDSGKGFHKQGLSDEQRGPFGGRIMWFPPYDLKFSENVSSQWNSHSFIGRGENIYTYTNTDRSGTLSFKIIIDHPSILDYWEGKGRDTANVGDVDTDGYENSLLRFFAGCEMLQAKPLTKIPQKDVPKQENVYKGKDTGITIKFYVFYPNDYSGKDYINGNIENAIDYLINGYGTSVGDPSKSYFNEKDVRVGGYEMQKSEGISMTQTIPTEGTYTRIYYGDKSNKKWQNVERYLDTQSGKRLKWCYLVDNEKKNEKLVSAKNYLDLRSNGLNSTFGSDTVATELSKLNSKSDEDKDRTVELVSLADMYAYFYENDKERIAVIEERYDSSKRDKIKEYLAKYQISSIEVKGYASSQYNSAEKAKRNLLLEQGRADTLAKWLKTLLERDGKTCPTITTSAAGEWDKDRSDVSVSNLGPKLRRCACVKINLSSESTKEVQNGLSEYSTDTGTTKSTALKSKATRSVTTYAKKWGAQYLNALKGVMGSASSQPNTLLVGDVPNAITRRLTYVGNDLSNPYLDKTSKQADMVQIVRGAANLWNYVKMSTYHTNALDVDYAGISKASLGFLGLYNNYSFDANGYVSKTKATDGNGTVLNAPEVGKNISKLFKGDSGDSKTVDDTELGTNVGRYDNEGDFFRALEVNDHVLHSKITDKIKYFDPAFHSISPEGFNARLTFLQQCTRQGPTYAASDANPNGTANNMSFGRPPVCILRIGDFYYTKIIIDSMSIDYEQQWDLNHEGIGVMPMIANVSLNFKFIGGSSLSGPISRLQNALSFNAYANTEVYDNRAERAEYDENGNLVSFQPYIASNK